MKRALLVGLVTCALGALAYGVEYVLELRAATAPPTPEAYVQTAWTLYRLAPGHRVHVSEQGIPCEQCHEASGQGRFDEPGPGACASCHEEQTTIEHVKTAIDEKGRRVEHGGVARMTDCLSCHGFGPDPDKKADDCLSCHVQAKGGMPPVVVHANETCTNCHDVHANTVAPIACSACHQVSTQHGEHAPGSAAQCLDCHHAHGAAATARSKCADCHAAPDSKVAIPASATEGGHTCLGCHAPHRFEAKEVKSCESCHRAHPTLKGAGHERCTACHAPHDARASVARANVCTSCHRDVALDHGDSIDASKSCTSCHVPHPARGTKERLECTSCHADVAASDHAAHAPGTRCVSCHAPHDFDRPHEDRGACESCHKPRMRELANTGHARCESCHEALPHHGLGAEKPCASCHEQGAKVHSGHRECTSCHDAHTGARPVKLCTQCHAEQTQKLSPKHGECKNCHEPHAATPTPNISACTGCHSVAKLPALHRVPEHHARCQTCHEAHPEQPPDNAARCRSCHEAMRDHQPEATQCSGCHPFEAPPAARRKL